MSIYIYLLSVTLLFSYDNSNLEIPQEEKAASLIPVNPKNVILLIGDGMGISQLYAGYTVNKGKLNITKCKHIGIQTTYSFDNYITDSGASGTAIACGKKTRNGMIGMGPDSSKLNSILKLAKKNSLAAGLVSTSAITHATPASFIANQVYRYMYEEIALDFLKTDIDVIIGGGIEHFSNRSDGLNLLDSLKNKGYHVSDKIDNVIDLQHKKVAYITANEHNPPAVERGYEWLSLATSASIDVLKQNGKGFFLMVEGSQIDWGGHENNTEYIVSEVIDFDKAVGVALDFAKENGETLVIITADHETGGMGINYGDINSGELNADYTTNEHTGVWLPVFAFGPGAEHFIGFYDNTDIFYKMKYLLGL